MKEYWWFLNLIENIFIYVLDQNNTCYNAILLDLESERRECSCQVDCDEEDYTATTSAATFPEYKYRVTFSIKEY